MALESGTYVKDLVSTNPPGTDAISQGDDHIRLIKSVLQNSFPSNSDAPIIPDVSGNGGKYLQVNSGATATQWGTIRNRGYLERSIIQYDTASQIKIGSGAYELDNGSSPETFYWDSELTFVLGSSGSNASSSALGTDQWQYIYMDESAISASPLVASSFLNSTTAPTYSQSKHGWYNGSDRCIFAVYINGSGDIMKFYGNGTDHISWDNDLSVLSAYPVTNNAFTSFTVNYVPAFSSEAEMTFQMQSDSGSNLACSWFWRTGGSTSDGHKLGITEHGNNSAYDESHITKSIRGYVAQSITDTTKSAEYKAVCAVQLQNLDVFVVGWYLPKGI